jgi:hypothetical protein
MSTEAIAGILGLAGAAAGVGGVFGGAAQERKRLEQQKKIAWQQYLYGQEYSRQQFDLQQTEAKDSLGIQQARLDENVSMATDQFNASLLAQAYGIQDAQIQTASQVGASRAAEGMSGTRGNGANELARAYAETSLDRNVDLQYRQNDMALAGMTGQATSAAADIRREAASWDPGGYRYESKAAQDAYNRNIAELGQTNFDWAIGNAAATPMDLTVGAFNGLSSGLSLFDSVYNVWNLSGFGKKKDTQIDPSKGKEWTPIYG